MTWHPAGPVSVRNVTFTDCLAQDGSGGAASFEYTEWASVDDSRFLRCAAPSFSGGALSFWHGGGAVTASLFEGCSALRGGAVTIEGGPKDDACEALGPQGDWCLKSPVSFRASAFLSNAAGTDGGALEIVTGGSAQLDFCALVNNTAKAGSAGAVYVRSDQQRVALRNSTLSGNSALRCGAVGVDSAAAVEVADSALTGNVAGGGDGGAVCYAQPRLEESIHNCVSGIVLDLAYPTGCAALHPHTHTHPHHPHPHPPSTFPSTHSHPPNTHPRRLGPHSAGTCHP